MNWTFGPGQFVAAAAVVAAGLPTGEAVVREITGHHHDVAALVIPGDDPELADAALAALLIAAGRDGPGIRAGPMPGQLCRPARRRTG